MIHSMLWPNPRQQSYERLMITNLAVVEYMRKSQTLPLSGSRIFAV